jgi:hypothetical protein
MKKLQVTGCEQASAPLIINVDTIYVHTDIVKVEQTEEENGMGEGMVGDDMYSYTEYQYTYQEFKDNYKEAVSVLEDNVVEDYINELIASGEIDKANLLRSLENGEK